MNARSRFPFFSVIASLRWQLLWTTLAVSIAAVIAEIIEAVVLLPNLSLVFLTAVLFSAVTWGFVASIYASILAVIVYNFFFVPPVHTFVVGSPQDLLTLTMFLVVATLTSHLAGRVRNQAEAARERETTTSALYALSREVAAEREPDGVLRAVVSQITALMGAEAVVLLPDEDGLTLSVGASGDGKHFPDEDERQTYTWVWNEGVPAGRGTGVFPDADWLYVPLHTGNGMVGVLGVRPEKPKGGGFLSRRRLLEAFADQSAVAIERARLAQNVEIARLEAEEEKLRSMVLLSISHDLRTPLASIIGSATSLLSPDVRYDSAMGRELLETIQEEALRLNQFVGNLLDMARLESGSLRLNREWTDIEEVIGAALTQLSAVLGSRKVELDIEPEMRMLSLDFVLIQHVFVNLLDNAAKYSPPDSRIRIRARDQEGFVTVEVQDEGMGVPEEELERIFDKFHRVSDRDRQRLGAGLGLAICRGLVEAHGGQIAARKPENDAPGLIVRVVFPVEKEPPWMESETSPSTPLRTSL